MGWFAQIKGLWGECRGKGNFTGVTSVPHALFTNCCQHTVTNLLSPQEQLMDVESLLLELLTYSLGRGSPDLGL